MVIDKSLVTFIIVVRNAKFLVQNLLEDLLLQDFPQENLQIILVDSNSIDGTLDILKKFASENNKLNIRILNNPKKNLSCGWNIAIRNSCGKILIRVDAHARIPKDFIRKNVECILSGENICGGYLEVLKPTKFIPRMIAYVESSKFGGGNAPFRNAGDPKYVDTIAYAAYKKEVFDRVGLFNERLVRNQDNEMHYRIKEFGYKFYFNPSIHSFYTVRSSLLDLLKQKLGNGNWVGLTIGISPYCFKLRHFIPLFFVVSLLFCVMLFLNNSKNLISTLPLVSLLMTYFCLAFFNSVPIIYKEKGYLKLIGVLVPFIFISIHLAYGLGTLWGIIKLPYFWATNKGIDENLDKV